jgi:uncharacterized Zn finger protein
MGAPTQLGTELLIGLNGKTYSGAIVESASVRATGDVEAVKNEDNETGTKIISDPGQELTVEMILEAGTDTETIKKGDAVTVDGVAYMVDDVETKYSRGAAKVTLKLIKEDSMDYSGN